MAEEAAGAEAGNRQAIGLCRLVKYIQPANRAATLDIFNHNGWVSRKLLFKKRRDCPRMRTRTASRTIGHNKGDCLSGKIDLLRGRWHDQKRQDGRDDCYELEFHRLLPLTSDTLIETWVISFDTIRFRPPPRRTSKLV